MIDAMAAVAEATADVARVQPLNGITDKTYPYAVYSATLGRGDVYLLDSSEGIRHGRVVTQAFGKTAASALSKNEQVRAALVGLSLEIDGYDTTPCRAELDPTVDRDPDDAGVVGVTATYTFEATQEA